MRVMSDRNRTVLIAVDAGGTGCRAAAGTVDDGILGEARGGPSNVENSFDGAIANIVSTVHEALEDADLGSTPPGAIVAHIGAAGANSSATMQRVSARLPYGRSTVTGDKDTTVAGALGPHDGFVLGVGTGTFIARQREGAIATVAGWGFQLSDQASGAWLGHQALQRALFAHDHMAEHSDLTRAMLERFDGLHGMLEFCLSATPTTYATLAPDVLSAAANDDPVARAIVAEAVSFLEKGLAALDFHPGDRLCMTGGVGPRYAEYLSPETMKNVHDAEGNALQGAFALARAEALDDG